MLFSVKNTVHQHIARVNKWFKQFTQ